MLIEDKSRKLFRKRHLAQDNWKKFILRAWIGRKDETRGGFGEEYCITHTHVIRT